jgi:hypothetical protein
MDQVAPDDVIEVAPLHEQNVTHRVQWRLIGMALAKYSGIDTAGMQSQEQQTEAAINRAKC